MNDLVDFTFADDPDGDPPIKGAPGSADIVAGTISTQHLVIPEGQMEELLDRVKAHKNKGLPTQVVHPWRTVVRTLIQHLAGLIVAGLIWLLASIGVDVTTLEADLIISVTVLLTLAFSGAVARIMAHPRVEDFFVKYISPLATGVADE